MINQAAPQHAAPRRRAFGGCVGRQSAGCRLTGWCPDTIVHLAGMAEIHLREGGAAIGRGLERDPISSTSSAPRRTPRPSPNGRASTMRCSISATWKGARRTAAPACPAPARYGGYSIVAFAEANGPLDGSAMLAAGLPPLRPWLYNPGPSRDNGTPDVMTVFDEPGRASCRSPIGTRAARPRR
jgi:hypothetical protein